MIRGRLLDASAAPVTGERVEEVVGVRNVVVEQVVSGEVDGPLDYLQQQDEWVVVLSGAAVLEVGGERIEMEGGHWALLPGGVPHRLISVEPGTNWLGVHVHADANAAHPPP